MKLTARQKKFCDEYLIDLNATQAAIRAGYSKKTAQVISSENLSKPMVKEYLASKMGKREKRTEITQDRVLQELAKIAFFDPKKLFDANGSPIPLHELDDETSAVIAGLDLHEEYEGSGDDRKFVGYTKKIKLLDKNSALSLAMRHLGMLNDKMQLDVQMNLADRVKTARQRSK